MQRVSPSTCRVADRGFYTYRQLCRYLLKLARRCAGIPSEDKWPAVLDLDLKRVTALSVSNFITRIKLGAKLDSACKTKAEREVKDKQVKVCLLMPSPARTKKNSDVPRGVTSHTSSIPCRIRLT